MERKDYEKPMIEIIELIGKDIITESTIEQGDNELPIRP